MLQCHCPVYERLSQVEHPDSHESQQSQVIDLGIGDVICRISTDERRVRVLDTIHAGKKRLRRRAVGTAENRQCSGRVAKIQHESVYFCGNTGLHLVRLSLACKGFKIDLPIAGSKAEGHHGVVEATTSFQFTDSRFRPRDWRLRTP